MHPKSLLFAAVLVAPVGCGEVLTTSTTSSSSTSSGAHGGGVVATGSAGTSSAGGAGGSAPVDTITLSAQTVRSPSGTPLPDVTVCVYAEPAIPCVQSDAQGQFGIPVPSYTETGVTLARQGSGSVLLPFVTEGQDLSGWRIGMPASAAIEGFYSAAGASYPDTASGFLEVWTDEGNTETGIEGIPISISPASGSGPFYGAPGGAAPDPTLQATSAAGFARFAELTPGVATVQIAPGALSCVIRFGGWPQDAASLRAPIVAGFETHVAFGCN